jgi:hypothetical protein
MSADEAGDMSAGDSSDPGTDVSTVSTYIWSTRVDVETSNEVSDTPGNAGSYTRRLRQDDSDWEAFQDSDTDSYSSVK